MDRPETMAEVRTNHAELTLSEEQRKLLGEMEGQGCEAFGSRRECLFGVQGHVPRHDLRAAFALAMCKHPALQLDQAAIARYLHCTEEHVERYLTDAETFAVSGAGSATGADMRLFIQYVGPALSQIIPMA